MGLFDSLKPKAEPQQPVINPNITQYQQIMYQYQQRLGGMQGNYGSVVTNQEALMCGEHEKKLPKGTILNIISENISQAYGVAVRQLEKIDECPESLKHACFESATMDKGNGIHFLSPVPLTVPVTNLSVVTIHSYFCPCCGKLFISEDEINIY